MEEMEHILLVDDRPENLIALEAVLAAPDLKLVKAGSGEEALAAMLEQEFALVLLDVQMPGMDGFETAQLMRSTEKTRYVPIIFVTAIDKEKHFVFQGYESGAVDYLFKPLDPDIVRSKARVFRDLYRQRRKIERQAEEIQRAHTEVERAFRQTKEDLRVAALVQRSLLPAKSPDTSDATFAWKLLPCDELAGDIFDVIPLGEHHLGVYLLDVSGHGVQAALLSCALSTLIRAAPGSGSLLMESNGEGDRIVAPNNVLRLLDQRFPQDMQTCQYFTMIYGVLDLRSGEFRIALAGHPPPILVPAQGHATLVELQPGPGIGLASPGSEWSEATLTLQSGDRLYFYSDGLPEAMDAEREEFEEERLVALAEACRERPLGGSIEFILEAITTWTEGNVRDDLSILAVHRT